MPVLGGSRFADARLEIAFNAGFQTPAGDRVWTDVSEWLEGDPVGISRGRADEFETVSPSTLTFTLDNTDGRFTPGLDTSPYSPNVKKGRPVRYSTVYDGVSYVRFTGYVDEWPVVWPNGTNKVAQIAITASSRLARLGKQAALVSAIRHEYALDGPADYYAMNDNGNLVAGANNDDRLFKSGVVEGRYLHTAGPRRGNIVFLDREGPVDEDNMPKFPAGVVDGNFEGYAFGTIEPVNTGGEATIEAVVRVKPKTGGPYSVTNLLRIGSLDGNIILELSVGWYKTLGSVLALGVVGSYLDPADSDNNQFPFDDFTNEEALSLIDGELHHVALTVNGDTIRGYLDGTLMGAATFSPSVLASKPLEVIYAGSALLNSDLWIAHMAVYDEQLTAVRLLAHAQAATSAPESVADRIKRILRESLVPNGEVVAEDSSLVLAIQPQSGRTGLEILAEIAETEGGVLFDGKDGLLYYHARSHRYNQDSAFTLDGNTDQLGADLQAILDDRYLINEFVGTNADESVTVTSTNSNSLNDYGLYHTDRKLVTLDANHLAQTTHWFVNKYGEPLPRVSQVTVDLTNMDTDQRAEVLSADIGSKVAIVNLPAQAPWSDTTMFVEGYSETVTPLSHTITFNTTPDIFGTVFVLDQSSLNGPDVLAY